MLRLWGIMVALTSKRRALGGLMVLMAIESFDSSSDDGANAAAASHLEGRRTCRR